MCTSIVHLVQVSVRGEEAHDAPRDELAHVDHEPAELVQLLVRPAAVEGEIESLPRGPPVEKTKMVSGRIGLDVEREKNT